MAAKLPVICLMGPTASGKTAAAIALCQQFPCDIISVDSAMVYRGMDIGTAKPNAAELAVAPHRLIDILDPSQVYSAADFRRDAIAHIQDIQNTGRIPLLVGGTMLYFKALLEGISELPEANSEVRAQIQAEAEQAGWHALHQQLTEIDPVSAQRIHPNDPQRLSRALEVYRVSGKTLTELTQTKSAALPYQVLQFALVPESREVLHQRIEQRFDSMLAQGFEQEVQALRQRGDLNVQMPSMRAVGYRQMWEFLDGEYDAEQMRFKGIVATRQLAKRQLTWLRNWPKLTHLDSLDSRVMTRLQDQIEEFLDGTGKPIQG